MARARGCNKNSVVPGPQGHHTGSAAPFHLASPHTRCDDDHSKNDDAADYDDDDHDDRDGADLANESGPHMLILLFFSLMTPLGSCLHKSYANASPNVHCSRPSPRP